MNAELLKHINQFVPLTDQEAEELSPYFSYIEISKKDHLFKEGHICPANYFIAKGCLRMYNVNDKGIEHIIQFGIENWWITDYMSMDKGGLSVFNLQAIEASVVISFEKKHQEEAFKKVPALERYFRMVTQRAYAAAQHRFLYFYDQSAEERYRFFSGLYPGFVQRIPQYMLASYLNFTPEFLSKLRAKKK